MTKIPKLFLLMQKENLTSKALSQATNISEGNISDWKSGRSMPSTDKLIVLAEFFHCSVDYLLDRTDNPNSIANGDIRNSSVAQATGNNNKISIKSKHEHPYAEIIEHLDSLSSADRRHAIADLMDVLENQYPVKKK